MRKQALHPHTAVINSKQKNQSKKARSDALIWLAKAFPNVFDNSTMIQPLKLGIMADILMHGDAAAKAGISKSKLRQALVVYTRRIDYLTCLKAREMRVDLSGNPVSAVTEEEAERAALKIKKRIEKSSKNARKEVSFKSEVSARESTQRAIKQEQEEVFLAYSDRTPAYSAHHPAAGNITRSTEVVIKQKSSAKRFDPEAVARLKEKLGLSHKEKLDVDGNC